MSSEVNSPLSPQEKAPPSTRFVASVVAVTVAIFVVAYAQSFRVKPASDDWPIVTEMQRGNLRGVSVFFTDSVIRIGYRPLKSVAIWAMGNLGGDSIAARVAWIRAMHLLGAIGYMLVAVLWVRQIGLRRAGSIVAIALMLLHPVLPQATGSIDGIDTLASSALLWLRRGSCTGIANDQACAIAGSLNCFIVGVGFKENLFAIGPLSFVIVLMFWNWRDRRVLRNAIVLLATLAIASLAMIFVRFYVVRGGLEAGGEMLRFTPRQFAENVTLFASGLFFFGDTIWVYVNQSKPVLALVGVACLTSFAVVVGGLYRRGRDGWTAFLLIGLAVASFPTILLYHVSEMYVPPMLLPFALLAALAADAWMTGGRTVRFIVGMIAGAAFAFSIVTIRHKIAGLVEVGERADAQLKQVLTFVPADARNKRIMLLFDRDDLPPRRTYSVFRMGDEILLVHEPTLEWYRPGHRHVLQSIVVDDPATFDRTGWDVVLVWDAKTQRYSPLRAREGS